jgi:HlyD family secretion protein
MNQETPLRQSDIEKAIGITRGQGAKRWLGRLVWLAVAGAILAAGLWWYAQRQQAAETVTYQTAPAARDNMAITVAATGTIQPITQVDVGSELSGIVREVRVDDNDAVKAGDILAVLDTARLEAQRLKAMAQLQAAEARKATAQASLSQTQLAFERQRRLRGRGLSTGVESETATGELDRARASMDAATADIAIARADLSLVDADLAKALIVSPVDGIVLKRSVEPGQTVAASMQAPILFTIAQNLKRIQLEAAVDESDVGVVAVGQTATFVVDAYRERSFPAKIERMSFSPETVDGVVTYKTILSAANDDLALRPGMTATAKVTIAEYADALTIPNEALRYAPPVAQEERSFSINDIFMPRFPRQRPKAAGLPAADGTRGIFILENGQPKELRLKVGDSDGKRTIVVEGELKEADEVILSQRTGAARPASN